jgi:hypothetical protein
MFSRHRSSRLNFQTHTLVRTSARQLPLVLRPSPGFVPIPISCSPLPLPSSASHSRGSQTFWVPLKATCPLKICDPNLPPPTPRSLRLDLQCNLGHCLHHPFVRSQRPPPSSLFSNSHLYLPLLSSIVSDLLCRHHHTGGEG